jgi:hypothetical protein
MGYAHGWVGRKATHTFLLGHIDCVVTGANGLTQIGFVSACIVAQSIKAHLQ